MSISAATNITWSGTGGSGSATLTEGAVVAIPAGSLVTFSLVTTTGVSVWSVSFWSDNATINGQLLQGQAKQSLALTIPVAGALSQIAIQAAGVNSGEAILRCQLQSIVTATITPGQNVVTLVNGLNSNVPTNGLGSIRVAGPNGPFSIGGFAPGAGGWSPGQKLDVLNTTSQVMTIVHEDTSSTAGNRVSVGAGVSCTVPAYSRIRLLYDGTSLRFDLAQSSSLYRRDLDVREYGAVGDGSNDDTSAIQATIDAVSALGGGIVRLPVGTFKLTSSLNLSSNVHLVGSGQNTIINQANATTAITTDSVINWAIKNLEITSGGNAIDLKVTTADNQQGVIEDVRIKNIGSSAIGIALYCNNGPLYHYFHRFRNVEIVIFVTTYGNAKAVSCIGTTGGVIGLSWKGGRCCGPGIGLDIGSTYQCSFSDIALDGLFNDGAKVNVTAIDTNPASGTYAQVTTASPHGFTAGQIIRIQNCAGVNGLRLNYFQVAATPAPTATTFVLYSAAPTGTYTGGGTVCAGNGIGVNLGPLASGNMISGFRIEQPDIAKVVVCDAQSYANKVDFGPDMAFSPNQVVDPNGSNIFYLGQGPYINTDARPQILGKVSLQYGMAQLNGLTKTAKALNVVAGVNDDIVNGTWNSGQPVSSSLYANMTGPGGPFYVTGFKVGNPVSGMEIDLINPTGYPMSIDHLDFIGSSSNGNKTATLTGSPIVLPAQGGAARFIYNSTLDSGHGAWLCVSSNPSVQRGTAPAGGAITNGTYDLTAVPQTTAFTYLTFHGTLTGDATIILPAFDGAWWFIDCTQMVLGGHVLTLRANGVNWGTTLGTAVYYVAYSTPAGKLYGTTLAA